MPSACLLGKNLDDSFPQHRQYGARHALIIMSLINLLNYADRYVPSAVKQLIEEDLHLNDFESALPTTGMTLVYIVFAIVFGILSDMQIVDRRKILMGAICFWSVATATAGLSQNVTQLIILRSLVGVGEAAYATIVPPLIADFYPDWERNVAYGVYFLAIPLGSALGYGIGAILGSTFGWRVAFFIVGVPGVIVAVCILFISNPVRGINDPEDVSKPLLKKGSTWKSKSSSSGNLSSEDAAPVDGGQIEEENLKMDTKNHARVEGGNRDSYTLDAYSNSTDMESAGACKSPKDVDLTGETEVSSSQNSQDRLDKEAEEDADKPAGCCRCCRCKCCCGCGAFCSFFRDVGVILSNPIFMVSTIGYASQTFALGGLADWYATFLYRYTSANLDTAGLAVGALTIVGGLGGNILGAKVADYFRPSVPNAYFLVPALFTIPGTVCLGLAVNMTQSFAINMVFLCLAQIFAWTSTAPMSSMSIASVPPPLRAKSAAVNLLIIHALGDVVSPPIIGALSDEWDSLRKALQITWAMTALAGVIWFLGFAFIRPLDSKEVTQSQESMREVERLRKQSDILLEDQVASARMLQAPPVPTYYNLVIARQPLMLDRASNTIVKRVTATLAQGHAGETLNAIHENVDDTNEAFEGNVESGPRDSTRPSDGQQSSEIR